jgi:hypothetical protein
MTCQDYCKCTPNACCKSPTVKDLMFYVQCNYAERELGPSPSAASLVNQGRAFDIFILKEFYVFTFAHNESLYRVTEFIF